MSRSNLFLSECKVCGTAALYSYYGVVSCESCKMFFKRNAETQKKIKKCNFNGQCEVNIHTRHACSACRLIKCFKVGMCTGMIRSARPNKNQKVSTSSKAIQLINQNTRQPKKFSTLNLLEHDNSLLSTDQWTLLSNLIHSYDEHDALPVARNFMKELDSLHPKLRFKIGPNKIVEICTPLYQAAELFVQSNQDFTSLPIHDRSIILRSALENISCLGGSFVLRQSGLITNSAFRNALENTYGTMSYNFTLNLISLLDQDLNLVKLTLSLFTFCTSNCTLFNENTSLKYLKNNQSVLHVQNLYAELIWKYLLYKHTFNTAVIRFNQLVQCLVVALTCRTYLQVVKNHTDAVESLIQKIEQQQINNNDNYIFLFDDINK